MIGTFSNLMKYENTNTQNTFCLIPIYNEKVILCQLIKTKNIYKYIFFSYLLVNSINI